MPVYKKINSVLNKELQTLTYEYWLEEEGQGKPDHVLLIKMPQLLRNYAAGLHGICPECVARGIYSPMQRNEIHGVNPLAPIAVIDTCIKCGIKSNGLFYYWEGGQ